MMQTARTLGAGNVEAGVEGGGALPSLGGSEGLYALPIGSLVGRVGVHDRIDVGARVGYAGVAAQTKLLLTNPADSTGFRLAIVPELAVSALGSNFFVDVNLAVLTGVPIGDHELTLGLLSNTTGFSFDDDAPMLLGGSVGFAFRVGSQHQVMPELGYKHRVVGQPKRGEYAGPGFRPGRGELMLQVGILIRNERD